MLRDADSAGTAPPSDPTRQRMQRARGRAAIAVRRDGSRTRLVDLHQSGCLKLRMPRVAGEVPEAVLINTAGGLTGGDRGVVEVEAGDGARLAIATQTAERLYRASEGHAALDIRIGAGRGSRVSWLPQETIAFEGSALRRTLRASMDVDATLLVAEPLVLGREAMGETIFRCSICDDWHIHAGGRLLHAEALRLGPDAARWTGRAAGWGGARAGATVLLVGAAAPASLDAARALIGETGAADAWPGGDMPPRLVARLLAPDGFALRRRLVPLLGLLHGAAMGLDCPANGHEATLPRVWAL